MSPTVVNGSRSYRSFPRVSGDEPYGQETTIGIGAFSPRERG